MIDLKNYITDIADFPKPGILFRDMSPLLADVQARNYMVDLFDEILSETKPNVLAGLDARGFIVANLLAERYQLPMMMVRKAGKLPGKVRTMSYDLEYGSNSIQIQNEFL